MINKFEFIINERTFELTEEEARELYNDLHKLFGSPDWTNDETVSIIDWVCCNAKV